MARFVLIKHPNSNHPAIVLDPEKVSYVRTRNVLSGGTTTYGIYIHMVEGVDDYQMDFNTEAERDAVLSAAYNALP